MDLGVLKDPTVGPKLSKRNAAFITCHPETTYGYLKTAIFSGLKPPVSKIWKPYRWTFCHQQSICFLQRFGAAKLTKYPVVCRTHCLVVRSYLYRLFIFFPLRIMRSNTSSELCEILGFAAEDRAGGVF